MRVVILGEGGYARMLEAFLANRAPILTSDDNVVGPTDDVIIGVGDVKTRRRLFKKFERQIQPVHVHEAWLGMPRNFGRGAQLMPGSVIQPNSKIGDNVLINTGAQIDHDCRIGDHCVIAPGAILCGNVTLGEGCEIGAGAIILQEVTLDAGTIVPAGTLVVASDDFRKPVRDPRRTA